MTRAIGRYLGARTNGSLRAVAASDDRSGGPGLTRGSETANDALLRFPGTVRRRRLATNDYVAPVMGDEIASYIEK
jgi:hypothetical protein